MRTPFGNLRDGFSVVLGDVHPTRKEGQTKQAGEPQTKEAQAAGFWNARALNRDALGRLIDHLTIWADD